MAIDIKELRIGSHVLVDGVRREVFGIGCGRVSYLTHPFSSVAESVLADKVEPIPITPELLTELGFKKIDFHGQDVFRKLYKDIPLGKMYYVLSYNSNAEAWDFTVHTTATTVKYLHELESMVYHATKRELISK